MYVCMYLDQSGFIPTYKDLNSRPVLTLVAFSTKTNRPYAEIMNSQGIRSSGMLHSVDWYLAKFRNNLSNLKVSRFNPCRWYVCNLLPIHALSHLHRGGRLKSFIYNSHNFDRDFALCMRV